MSADSYFERGEQPCQHFKPTPGIGGLSNRHECYRCGGTVSFCDNCKRDHHENGYKTCGERKDKRHVG